MLDYNLDDRGGKSLYDYLYQRIRDDITNEAIGAGDLGVVTKLVATRTGDTLRSTWA